MFKNAIAVFCFIFSITAVMLAADAPDNSKKNKTQVQNQELDARDQGNSKADVDMTAQIRKDIVAQKSFSINAKNVKIITAGGQVTLKGPVNSVEEKSKIHDIAVKLAGIGHVNDEIEIVNK